MNTAEIFRDAPKYISQRFYAINSYVWKSLFPENTLNERLRVILAEKDKSKELKRLKDIADEASLVVLILLLRKFFNEGSNSAIKAVDLFKELGVDGFQIGSKYFTERNENVMEGELLAESLMETIKSNDLRTLILQSEYPYQILNRYKELIY